MEREKKQVWKHWTVIKKDKNKKHPRAQCNYCRQKVFERAIPKRMQNHLDKCSDAPDNAKSPKTRHNFGSYLNEEEQKPFKLLLNKALTLVEMLSSYPSAVQWYQKDAENGNVFAQYFLGKCYENGDGFEKDEYKAFEWYKKSAEKEYSKAQCRLGFFYKNGVGTEKDLEEAFNWYQKAAENGCKEAQYNLGLCYINGDGIEKDVNEALKWYKKSAEQEHNEKQNKLGYFYNYGIGTDEHSKAFYWNQKAVENGDEKAQYNLALCYEYGDGIEKDEAKALEWYKKSAEQGYTDAQDSLGTCYRNGIGTEKDLEKAFYWYQKAAENNECKEAQYNLAVCYENGIGVEKDEVKAFELYKKLTEEEYSKAQNKLGYLYENGIGIEKDLEAAFCWYQKAAENENKFAQYNLGACYEDGVGVEENKVKALEWYKKSAIQEYSKAQSQVGSFYKNGIGTEKNLKEAFYWYERAAKYGDKYAQYNLGVCYEVGIGVKKDEVKAFKWYKKSAKQGYTDAQAQLEQNISSWVPELPAFEHGIMEGRVVIGHQLWTSKVPDSGHERWVELELEGGNLGNISRMLLMFLSYFIGTGSLVPSTPLNPSTPINLSLSSQAEPQLGFPQGISSQAESTPSNSRNHNTIQDHRHYDKPTSLLISSNSTDLGQSMPIVDALYNEDKFQVEDKLSRQIKLPCQNASRLDQQNHYDGNEQDEPHINSEFDDFSRRRKINSTTGNSDEESKNNACNPMVLSECSTRIRALSSQLGSLLRVNTPEGNVRAEKKLCHLVLPKDRIKIWKNKADSSVCQVLLGDEINGVHGCRSNLPITTFAKFMIVLWLEVGKPFEEDDEILAFKKAKETEARKNGKSVGEIIKTRSAEEIILSMKGNIRQ
uniref:BED-type domain-containing protein n=2 Tax=Rhizophagus irregularis (strain DAOM 181602 / DAOM 197198 / MUCL 43194) TaxID=747089 RepID=U9SJG8_RHIID